jgi:hypothetical protein
MSRVFEDEGIAAKATRLVENAKPLREKVWKFEEMQWLLKIEGGRRLRELM